MQYANQKLYVTEAKAGAINCNNVTNNIPMTIRKYQNPH